MSSDQARKPQAEISAPDALRLALQRWPWLVFVPLCVMVISTFVYMSFPVPNRAIAVLNTDSASVEAAIKRAKVRDVPGLAVWHEEPNLGNVVLTAEAQDAETALKSVNEVIMFVPPNVVTESELSSGQLLELRAHRQYIQILQDRLATGSATVDVEPALVLQEIELVQNRLRRLQAEHALAEVKPVISMDASIVPTRTPPTRNVIFFSLIATLFAVWMVIYGLEVRRMNRWPTSA